jgi:hypothetical protein
MDLSAHGAVLGHAQARSECTACEEAPCSTWRRPRFAGDKNDAFTAAVLDLSVAR